MKPSVVKNAALRPLALLALSSLLAGCNSYDNLNPLNWFSDDEVNPPTELVSIDQEVSVNRRWSISVGNGQGDNYTMITPAIDGDVIYSASENGNVVAVNKESGEVIWRREVEGSIAGGVGASDDVVMLGTNDAEVIVLNQSDGSEKWRTTVSSEVLAAPQTNGDVVVAQTVDGKLIALSFANAEQRWTYETTLPALTLRGTSEPIITNGGLVIAGFSNGTVVAVDAENGVFRWEQRVAIPEGRYDIERVIDVDGRFKLEGTTLFASSYQGNLMAFDITTGRIVWGLEASTYHGIDSGFGNVYYSSDQSHVVAVRSNTENVVWENEELRYRQLSAPTAIANYVAIADFEGYIHLISQIDGRIVGRSQLDNDGIRAPMLADRNSLYVYGNSGRLMALELQ